jgi:uncharacterized protein
MHLRLVLLALLGLVGCAPTVNVATPDPVKIDVNMNVNIKSAPMQSTAESTAGPGLAERRRLRMGEIQELKNARVIGEDRDGYLKMVTRPQDEGYAAYAEKSLKDENQDRTRLYLDYAKQQGKPLEIIEQEYARQWSDRAYPGELIQSVDGTWKNK